MQSFIVVHKLRVETGHTESVKCEQDVKSSIAELYKEGSQRQ